MSVTAAPGSLPQPEGSAATRFLLTLALSAVLFLAIAVLFVWTVDPYGVAPVHLASKKWNAAKPMRQNIDRLLKPFEVWRYQPATVFLGTSRIHQSMNPAVLDGTRFAPAYNAAIPASTIGQNLNHIRLFQKLDPNLKVVVLETFFYDFLRDEGPLPERSTWSLVADYVQLNASLSAVIDSVVTLFANRTGSFGQHVEPGGYFVHDPWFDTGPTFNADAYTNAIAAIQRTATGVPKISASALEALSGIVQFCKAHGIELILVQAPNYAWDDYRILKTGLWPALSDQMHRLAFEERALSFAQHNAITEEARGSGMRWWYDPVHFSLATGTLMLQSIVAGHSVGPDNIMASITPVTVDDLMAAREADVRRWAERNPAFTREFDRRVPVSTAR